MSKPSIFLVQTYTALPERVQRLNQTVVRLLGTDRAARILEIGCGTGGQILSLAELLPNAQLVGVDISEPCIRSARAAGEASPHHERVQFLMGNYAGTGLPGGFDVILADSVLHLLDTADRPLLTKLCGDLLPGGLLIFTIPYDCFFNHVLWTVRRCFRLVRSRWSDKFIRAVARNLHRHEMSKAMRRERIRYMYLLPYRYWGQHLQNQVREMHLEVAEEQRLPHASWGQPKHCLCVCRKAA